MKKKILARTSAISLAALMVASSTPLVASADTSSFSMPSKLYVVDYSVTQGRFYNIETNLYFMGVEWDDVKTHLTAKPNNDADFSSLPAADAWANAAFKALGAGPASGGFDKFDLTSVQKDSIYTTGYLSSSSNRGTWKYTEPFVAYFESSQAAQNAENAIVDNVVSSNTAAYNYFKTNWISYWSTVQTEYKNYADVCNDYLGTPSDKTDDYTPENSNYINPIIGVPPAPSIISITGQNDVNSNAVDFVRLNVGEVTVDHGQANDRITRFVIGKLEQTIDTINVSTPGFTMVDASSLNDMYYYETAGYSAFAGMICDDRIANATTSSYIQYLETGNYTGSGYGDTTVTPDDNDDDDDDDYDYFSYIYGSFKSSNGNYYPSENHAKNESYKYNKKTTATEYRSYSAYRYFNTETGSTYPTRFDAEIADKDGSIYDLAFYEEPSINYDTTVTNPSLVPGAYIPGYGYWYPTTGGTTGTTSSSWTSVDAQIARTRAGSTYTIPTSLLGSKVVPQSTLAAAKKAGVNLEFKLSGGQKWEIKAADIDTTKNLNVEVDYFCQSVSAALYNAALAANPGAVARSQVDIGTLGSLGLEATVTVKFNQNRVGRTAKYYKYDTSVPGLRLVDTAIIDGNGYCSLDITEGGEYIIVVI